MRLGESVELRAFGGLPIEEAACVLRGIALHCEARPAHCEGVAQTRTRLLTFAR